jgi:ABC-2 type transport system permease protein
VAVRSQLLSILREMEARGGAGLTVRIVEPEPYSPEAQEAIDNYGISPQPVTSREAGRVQQMQLFLGVAFVSGPHEEVIPFLDRGLSPEYEIVRALRTVTQEKKKVVGVLRTDATIMGNFDLQARRQQPAWRVIGELRKQYEVRSLNPGAEIPADVDVLLVPQLASTTTPQLEFVQKYIDAGRPALLTVDPHAAVRHEPVAQRADEAPARPAAEHVRPAPAGRAQGRLRRLPREAGRRVGPEKIVFDTDNPHPSFAGTPPHVVFVGKRPDGTDPFDGADPVVARPQRGRRAVRRRAQGRLRLRGRVRAAAATGTRGGFNKFEEMVERHMLFGLQGPVLPRTRTMSTDSQVLAARVTSGGASGEGASKGKNVVVVADLDLFGDQFFVLNERGGDLDGDGVDDIRFDNVTFLLNAIDTLSGDAGLVELRGRKSKYRRLDAVDEETKDASDKRNERGRQAPAPRPRPTSRPPRTRSTPRSRRSTTTPASTRPPRPVLLKSAEEAENRRLNAKREQDHARQGPRHRAHRVGAHVQRSARSRTGSACLAVLVPPVPAILLGGFIFLRKRRREQDAIPSSRKRGSR